ncbi:unnamed protein product [Closterium sp. NIES-54]
MEVARTSMIYAAAPNFLWPFAVRYTAHQLNLWPHVSLSETSPTLCWTGKVGNASVFRVWGSHAFVHNTFADKLSARAIPCVFLGFSRDAPGRQFYHPTSRRVFPSQDVPFDESLPFYRLFPYRSAPPLPLPLFLDPSPPSVDPLPPQGLAPSGVSHKDPLPGTVPVEVAGDSGAARGAAFGGAESRGAEPGGAEPGGAETTGVEPGGAESEDAESGGAKPRDTASAGGAGVSAGACGIGGAGAAGPGRARTRGTGAAGTGGVGGARAGDPTEHGAAGAGGAGAGGTRAGGAGAGGAEAGGARAGGTGARGAGDGGAGAVDPGGGGAGAGGAGGMGAGGTVRPRPYFVPLLHQVLGVRPCAGLTLTLLCPPHDHSQPPLQPASPLPAPSPYFEQTGGLTDRREPASCLPFSVHTDRRVPRPRPPPVPGTHAMALRPSFVPLRVTLPPQPEYSLPAFPDPESDRTHAASRTVSRFLTTVVTDPSFESTAAFALIADRGSTTSRPSPPTLRVLLHVAAQHDYDLHSLDFSIAFLQGSLHETTLAALGFTTSTADPSLFLHIDTLLPPFYVLVYVDDLVFATGDTKALTLVKSELRKRHTCNDLGELRSYLGLQITWDRARRTITLTQSHMVHQVLQYFGFQFSSPQPTPLSIGHSLSAPPSDEFVEPSGPYPELVGCLMYLVTCTRPDLAYPLSLLARYVAPSRHRKVHSDAAKRVLRYLCRTSGMGLVLGGRVPVVLTGHADAFWVDDSAT